MDPFAFVIALVAMITVGRVVRTGLSHRELKGASSQVGRGDLEDMRTAIDGVMGRLERLEEERDFYKDLLDAPRTGREISPPDASGTETKP